MTAHDRAAGGGAVVLDIGGDVGALVLLTDADLEGSEIELRSVDRPDRRTHVAVWPRPVPGGLLHAAVYPTLHEGRYLLWNSADLHALPRGPVTVIGGHVVQVSWSELGEVSGTEPAGAADG